MLHVSVKRNATQKMDEFVLLHTMPRVHRPRPVPVVSVSVARYWLVWRFAVYTALVPE